MRWLVCFFVLSCLHCVLPTEQPQAMESIPATEIRQWASFAPGMHAYERELIALALKASEASYGEYSHAYVHDSVSWRRVLHDIDQGGNVHIAFSVGPRDQENFPGIDQYVLPDYRNLLGFRQLIVRREDQAKYAEPLSLKQFSKLRPGQGETWREVFIYRNAGLPLVTATNYDQLFPMLNHKRFDYIALGLLEMEPARQLIKLQYPKLTLNDTIYIYYPLKTYIFISSKIPNLRDRLFDGLDKIFSDGSEEELFLQLFADSFTIAQKKTKQIFVLDDPAYPEPENHDRTQLFLEHHGLAEKAIYLH